MNERDLGALTRSAIAYTVRCRCAAMSIGISEASTTRKLFELYLHLQVSRSKEASRIDLSAISLWT